MTLRFATGYGVIEAEFNRTRRMVEKVFGADLLARGRGSREC
jgi:hypothetical protein